MMRGFRTCWSLPVILILSLLCFCCNLSQARLHHQKHPAVVVGAVYCETCFQDPMAKGSHYISGATVAVECAGGTRPAFHQEVQTDKQGNFRVHLPFSVSKHVKEIEGCTVKLVKSSEPYCAVASAATSSLLRLAERKGDKHIYSAGFFTFKPLKQPGLCNQQPSVTKSQLNSLGDMLPPLPNTDIPGILTPDLPPLPTLPVPVPMVPTTPAVPLLPSLPLPNPELPLTQPQLPGPLPPFSALPVAPSENAANVPKKPLEPVDDSKFFFIPPVLGPPSSGLPITNPLNPPPLVQNPLQPPAPLIPNPLQPPTPPTLVPGLPNIPGIPGIPTAPTVPGLPTIPGIPTVPGLPTIPGIPNVPGLPGIPIIPPPPASLLPPLPPLLPGFGFPGLPPSTKPTKMNP